jgi:hypothetical protein
MQAKIPEWPAQPVAQLTLNVCPVVLESQPGVANSAPNVPRPVPVRGMQVGDPDAIPHPGVQDVALELSSQPWAQDTRQVCPVVTSAHAVTSYALESSNALQVLAVPVGLVP